MKTNKLTLTSLLISLAIIMTRIITPIYLFSNALRFDIGAIIIMFSGIALGPLYGLIVGLLADFIGANLFPIGPFYFGFMISSGLIGFIPGLVSYLLKKLKVQYSFLILVGLLVFINIAATSFILNSIDRILIKNPQVILTNQLALTIIIGLLLYSCAIIIVTLILKRRHPAKFNKMVMSVLSVLLVSIIVNICLTSYWIHDYAKVDYYYAFLLRLVLYLPYSIIPISFLSTLLSYNWEKTWNG